MQKITKLITFFYPFYFAIFPVLAFYSSNKRELTLDVNVLPAAISIFVTFLLLIFFRLIPKTKDSAAIIVTFFLIYFFSYQHISSLITLPYLYSMIFGLLLFVVLKIRKKANVHIILTILGLYLVFYNLVQIIPYETERVIIKMKDGSAEIPISQAKKQDNPPDIYYLIFDRYARHDTLSKYYGFENEDFYNFLKTNNFYIATESAANYPRTHLSLGSSLNLDYLDDLVAKVGKENSDYTPVFDIVHNNKVASFLKRQGYYYIYAGDWWEPTRVNRNANLNINRYAGFNEYGRKFLGTTILKPLIGEYYKGNNFFGLFQDRIYENTNYKFAKLGTIATLPSPKFVFAHMLIPHFPYLFDKDCRRVEDERKLPEKEKYLQQLICANTKIKKLVSSILTQSKNPPVIIIQSDEGPFKVDEMNLNGEQTDWTKVSKEAIKTHVNILNVYYLPGYDYERLYPSISPVNTFRLIFNHYFGTDLKLLEDRNYFIPNIDRSYSYTDITDIIRSK